MLRAFVSRAKRSTHLPDGLADRHLLELSPALLLNTLGQEHDLDIADLVEPSVRLLLRVDEMLDLGHRELADAEETLPRSNLVTERTTNLGRGKRHPAVVEFKQAREVDKVALSRLGPEEAARASVRGKSAAEPRRTRRELLKVTLDTPLDVAGRANRRLEHEVELLGLRQVVLSLGVLDSEATDELAELGTGVVVDLAHERGYQSQFELIPYSLHVRKAEILG